MSQRGLTSAALPLAEGLRELIPEASAKEVQILAAALELFVEHGFRGTTIPAIARKAGVAAGTIYLYFEGKEQLVNTLLGGLKRRLALQLQEAVREDDPVEVQFRALWKVLARFTLHHERAVAFLDLHHHAPYVKPETLAAWESGEQLLNDHFRRGRREGLYLDLTPEVLRSIVLGILIGAHKASRAGKFELTAPLLERLGASAWRAVTRPGR